MKKKLPESNFLGKKSSVLFATFAVYINGERLPANGMIEQMASFLLPKVQKLTLIIQPHPSSDRISPLIETYEKNRKVKEVSISPLLYLPLYFLCKIQNTDSTHISFKLRDLLSVLFIGLTSKKKYDFFIGLESINALGGIILKKLGKVKTVIYYVSDYAPKRYGNVAFNTIYLWLDKFCLKHSDFTWDVSPAIKEARLKAGYLREETRRILHVPNGLFPSQIDSLPISQRIPESIVYMGLLNLDQQGGDLALEAFKLVLKKKPTATFHIIGGTNRDSNQFMQMAKDLGLENAIISYGFIPPNEKMASIIKKCYLGIATYIAARNPRNRYGDSGKIRQYLGCGLPIVATIIQWYTRQAIKKGAGLAAKETPKDFARAIITLFENKALYKRCSQKALELSKNNTWENSYANAFLKMEKINLQQ